MKTVAMFLLIAVQGMVLEQQPIGPAGAWMPANAKWQHAPAGVAPRLLTSSTRVLYFQPDGKMIVIDCVVNREQGTYTTISAGDGQTVAAGEWREEQGRIIAHFRVVYRSVSRLGEKLPGPWAQDVLTLKGGQLLLKGMRYQRVPELDKSAAEMVPHPNQTSQ